jgi:hypothetical protein
LFHIHHAYFWLLQSASRHRYFRQNTYRTPTSAATTPPPPTMQNSILAGVCSFAQLKITVTIPVTNCVLAASGRSCDTAEYVRGASIH